ncbi:MAG: GIY-YIG nuclease family protein [Nitrososphaerota archaeon]|nr:GIY-YIG nuclease family protein [Nitrososphaerota archaeon]
MKGVYVLLLQIPRVRSIHIGSLGVIRFENGYYAYVGSAQSSLFPRLERHFAKRKKLHWHIDYLTSSKNIKIERAIYSLSDTKEFECQLSKEIEALSFSRAITSFGSSDCKHACGSHLFMLKSSESQVIRSTIHILRKLHLKPVTYQPRTLRKDGR